MRRAALALLVVAAARPAAAQTLDARLADLRLATAVRLALVRDAATRTLDVDVTAQDGAVRLAGADATSVQAERVAQAVAGVRSVNGAGTGARAASAEPEHLPARTEAPRTESPRTEAPRTETPGAAWGGRPRAEASRAEAPPEPSAASPQGPATLTVARGDTLFSLARRWGTTVAALRRLNGLGPADGIALGQSLRLR